MLKKIKNLFRLKPANLPAAQIPKITLERLEIHVTHVCNLTCDSCSHFSNSGHTGTVSIEEAKQSMLLWKDRLLPKEFTILGGEPTLHPKLSDLILLSREMWPDSHLTLVTNGFFLKRHPELYKTLVETNTEVHLSIQHLSQEYMKHAHESIELLKKWQEQYGVEYVERYSVNNWTRRYTGFAEKVMPYSDQNPRSSWEHCPAKICRQLFRGQLWKCSPSAYLQLQKETFPNLSTEWDPYLNYLPLSPQATDPELKAFLDREEESICNMCPAIPEKFEKPSPLRKRTELKQS